MKPPVLEFGVFGNIRCTTPLKSYLAHEEYLRVMDVYQFEEVVAGLLKKMSYGDLDDVWVTKKSNDEGIVGVLG